jgi:alpha-beta hydrolase superfamily lysophospholipase
MGAASDIRRANRPRLAVEIFAPAKATRAAVLLSHGYAEHAGRYHRVIDGWTKRGLLVATYDLRGHGRSEGRRGHVDSFREYLEDVNAVLGELERHDRWPAGKKPVLFGHSLGGLIAASVAAEAPARFAGLAMTSPFFGLALRVPKVKVWAGRVVSRILPTLSQPSGLKGSELTHDVDLAARYDQDPLHFSHVTARWFAEMEDAQTGLLKSAPRLTLPMFCLAAGDDRVASTPATQRLFARAASKDKELVVLQDLYHEVLNEPDRDQYIATLAERMIRWAA